MSNIIRRLLLPGLAVALLPVGEASSQVYVGASAGNAFINKDLKDVEGSDFTIDKNSFSYRFFGGYGAGLVGGEGGFRSLGTVSKQIGSTDVESKTTGWDVAARGKIGIGPVEAFGKAGLFFGKEEITAADTESDHSTSFLWGLGAGLRLGLIGFRLEYESLDLSSDNRLAVLSIGASLHLGG